MFGQFLTRLYRRKRFGTIISKKAMNIYMIRQKVRLPLVTLGLSALLLLSAMPVVQAAGPTSSGTGGNGLRVSPVRTDTTIAPGKSQSVPVTVTNVTSQAATLQAIINDFTANPNESGNPAIILDPNQYAPSHSLKRLATAPASVTLQPGQQKTLNILITIPANAAGGGYYGAVRFAPAGLPNSPNQTLSLAGSVGSLILVKVPGNVKEQLSIASFDIRSNDQPSSFFTSSKKLVATVRFQNQGNIQEEPFGKVLLKSGNTILGTYEINNATPPGSVLPDSIRKFPVPLDKLNKFGKFKVEGNFGYGASGQLLSASTTFYVIPKVLILIFIGVVLLLVFLIFGLPRIVKAYNRRVLRNARRY